MTGVKRRLAAQGIRVVLEKSGAKAILQASYDRNYGARPVERYLEKTIVTQLSKMLIKGKIASGNTVHIEAIGASSLDISDSYVEIGNVRKKAKLTYRVEKSSPEEEDTVMVDLNTIEMSKS